MARSASLEQSPWLPSFGWWPHPDEYGLSIILSTHHASAEDGSEYDVVLRGYADGPDSVWEHEVGHLRRGDECVVHLDDLDIPEPPVERGGIVEIHALRRDRPPKANVGFVGMWLEAVGRDGGGYLIPTIPIRGQKKVIARDDLQVMPGIVSSRDAETEVVLLNPIDESTDARLVASSASGLVAESEWFPIGPWSAWRGKLSNEVPRVRQLLAQDGGVGSLAVYSSHKLLPYFGFTRPGQPLVCMDHSAPIFA